MKAFLVGLVTLVVVAVMASLGALLYPFLIILGIALRVIAGFVLVLVAIWALGKVVIYTWQKIKPEGKAGQA